MHSARLAERVRAFFAPGGPLSRAHPAAEQRPQQLEMSLQVLQTLQDGGCLVAEAGTGVGKTLAYLLPAVLLKKRVIVSTGTKALQDQLASKDIPFLQRAAGIPFRAAVLKGRDNYLCKHRFEIFRSQPSFGDRDEASLWPRIDAWARGTELGEVGELTELKESPSFWPLVNARNATCLGQRCDHFADCHLQEVRRAAAEADVLVVNHHLFLADTVVRRTQFGAVLPDADTAIFDEAHALEPAATSFFGRVVSSFRVRELADDTLRELQRAGALPQAVASRADRLAAIAQSFSRAWGTEEGRFAMPARLPPAQDEALREVMTAARALHDGLRAIPGSPAAAEPLLRRSAELADDARLLAERDDTSYVHWYEVRGRGASVSATPLDVSDLLRESVFELLRASVLCSATLAVSGSMAHARARLGLADCKAPEKAPRSADRDIHDDLMDDEDAAPPLEVRELIVPSPFDYPSQALLYRPRSMPEPRERGFAVAVAQEAERLLTASRGRAFLLFTSYENLRKVHEILRHSLQFPILVQGEAPKGELIRRFRETEGSVLFATASFWEGIDVPGEALSLVVIDKLPFAVPSDPIVAARSRLIVERGGDSFRELAVPEAILALKQGVGRLVRSRSDRGVVAILDPRVGTSWGRAFLRDLPPFRQVGAIEDVEAFFAKAP